MTFETIMTFFGAVCAVIVGWSLGQVSQWYKGRKSDNRTRKRILYCMLEIYHTIPKLSIDMHQISDTISISLLKKFKITDPKEIEEGKEIMRTVVMPVLAKPLKELVADKFDQIDKWYEEAVANLSSVDPVLAYKLTGAASFLKHKDAFLKPLDEAMGRSEQPMDEIVGKNIKGFIYKKVDQDTLDFFKDNILILSRSIGRHTMRKTRALLKKQPTQKDTDEELDSLLDEYTTMLEGIAALAIEQNR